MNHQLPKKGNPLRKPSGTKHTSSSKDKVTILFIVLVHTMFSIHILHIYVLENNMFKEKLYLWKKNKIRIDITMTIRQGNTHERMKYINNPW
jgi:uncharacterized membrane protein YagU involved in acid resistance